jgi:hypothetical protein
MHDSRRGFLRGVIATAVLTAVYPLPLRAVTLPSRLYPPMDLSYFDKPITYDWSSARGSEGEIAKPAASAMQRAGR